MNGSRLALLLAAGLGVGAATVSGCRVPNEDHCLHKAVDSNEWCAENEEGRDFCSPCEAEHHGCVKEEPTEKECPEYTVPPLEETGTGTGTGADTGTDTATG